jgi:hypothetical protein
MSDLKLLLKMTGYIIRIAFWDYFTPISKYCERKGTKVREEYVAALDTEADNDRSD